MPAEIISPAPNLAELLQGFAAAPAVPVSGVASDSRALREGYLFLAVQGMTHHGLDFVEAAIAAGVAAIAYDASTGRAAETGDVPLIPVAGLASQVGEIASRFHGRPSERMKVIGVTGTNGKTTVAWMIARAAGLLGERCAYLGTLGYGVGELQGNDGMTTPPAVELHGRLAEFVTAGAGWAALEVSSHALEQGRVDGVHFDTALFTNLTRDHLDYHADMRAYFDSKARLFLEHQPRDKIINLDSEFGAQLASRCGLDVVTVSSNFDRVANGRPFVFIRSVVAGEQGSVVRFISSWGDGQFTLPLPGDFNVANAVIVLALLLVKGVPLKPACAALGQLTAPPGRMQRVAGTGPAVYVDYAHSPNALEVALRALRAHCAGKLWCVFGSGGDRDRGKRPHMGRAAERQADRVVITTDNPRSETPARIIDDIVGGLDHPEQAIVIEDRAAAIAWTVEQAADRDIVLVAGKGHESSQQIAGETLPFSDYGVAAAALATRGGAR